ncbi:MAG: AAA family ATPase, partial [Promethearchaeota archaeon]
MKFKLINIEIENLFGYKKASFQDLKNYNVLIGKNNAGKSNLFRILTALSNIFQGNELSPNILFDSNINKKASLTLTFSLSNEERKSIFKILINDRYFKEVINRVQGQYHRDSEIIEGLLKEGYYSKIQFKFAYYHPWETFIVEEINIINNKTNEISNLLKSKIFSEKELKYYLLPKEYIINSRTFKYYFKQSIEMKRMQPLNYDKNKLEAFFNNIIRESKDKLSGYHNPSFSKVLEDFLESLIKNDYILHIPDFRIFKMYDDMDKIEQTSLNPNGENLAKFILNKKVNDSAFHSKFNKELIKFFDINDEFSSKTEENKTYFYLKENGLKSDFRLENMGRGMLNIAHFLAFFLSIEKGKIILIEEPELHIFPGLQKKLRNKLLEFSENNQIIISTHSPLFLLENHETCSVYNVKKSGVESKVEKISNDELIKVFNDLDLSMYDFILYDGILFVEGRTDLNVFEIICNNLFEENLKIIPIEGKRNLEHYASAKIIRFLDMNKFKFLFILDKDRGNERFYERIENQEIREIIKKRTIVLPFYEIENLFIQPVLLLGYLYKKSKKKFDPNDFDFLISIIRDSFRELGENNVEYLLKKLNDDIFPRL